VCKKSGKRIWEKKVKAKELRKVSEKKKEKWPGVRIDSIFVYDGF